MWINNQHKNSIAVVIMPKKKINKEISFHLV